LPLYEYECPKDGTFERMQKFSDPPLRVCPTCGGPVEKLLSAPAIQFKGTGWYVTDYARKSGGEGSRDARDKGGPKESPAETKTAGSSSETKTSETRSSSSDKK
jgi:putative FmdB family regulatory protein